MSNPFARLLASAAFAAVAYSSTADAQTPGPAPVPAPTAPTGPRIFEPLCAQMRNATGGTTRLCVTDDEARAIQPGRPAAQFLIGCVKGDFYYLTDEKVCHDDRIHGRLPPLAGPSLAPYRR